MDTAQNVVNNPYKQLVEDNPKNIYSKGSDARNRRNEVLTAGAEFESDLALLDYQNQYNSPTEKAKRMREAGLNPDLLGISDVSDSSGLSGLTGSAQVTPDSAPNRASYVLDNIQTALGVAMQMSDRFETMKTRQLQNDSMAIDNQIKVEDYIRSHLVDQFDENGHSYEKTGTNTSFVSRLPRKYRKKSDDLITNIFNGRQFEFDENKGRTDLVQGKRNYAYSRSDPYYKSNPNEYADALKELMELRDKAERASLRSGTAEDNYNSDYYNNSSGKDDAVSDATLRDNAVIASDDAKNSGAADKEINRVISRLVGSDSMFDKSLGFALSWLMNGGLKSAADTYNSFRPRKRK